MPVAFLKITALNNMHILATRTAASILAVSLAAPVVLRGTIGHQARQISDSDTDGENDTIAMPIITGNTTDASPTRNSPLTCWEPSRKISPDFNCHGAYHQFLRDVGPGPVLVLEKLERHGSRKPKINLPKTWNDGSCEIKMDLIKPSPPIKAAKSALQEIIEEILTQCVKDEKTSRGGFKWAGFPSAYRGDKNEVIVYIERPRGAERPGIGASNGLAS